MGFVELQGDIKLDAPKKYKEITGNIQMDEHPLSTQYGGGKSMPSISQDRSMLSAGTREAISNVARPVLEYGGAAGGGVIGAFTTKSPYGAVKGSTLGYAGGKAAANVLDIYLGVPRKELIERTRSEHPVFTIISQTGNDLKYGAELEMGGQGASKVITAVAGKLISPLSKEMATVTGQTSREIPEEVQGLIKLYKEAGIKPSPSELVHGGKTLAIVESVLGYSPLSGDVILKKNITKLNQLMVRRTELINKGASDKIVEMVGNDIRKEAKSLISRYGTKQADKVDSLVNEFMGKYGSLSKYQSGLKFGEIAEGTRASMQEKINQLYADAKQALPKQGQDVVVLSDRITNSSEELLRAEMAIAPKQRNTEIIGTLEDFIRLDKGVAGFSPEQIAKIPALRDAVNPPIKMTWEGLDETRRALLAKSRDIYASKGYSTTEARVYTDLANKIDNELSTFAEQVNPEAKALLDKAREASRTLHEYFDKDLLKIMN
ncbi:MAG: hypothetical protein NUV80_02885, partial [Candidatus Berkelbacteria bacterium]|nr:hypothetical protein [Candidatus Berkelbacteria bacterium]